MQRSNPMPWPGGPRPISNNGPSKTIVDGHGLWPINYPMVGFRGGQCPRQITLLCSLLVLLGSAIVSPRALAQTSANATNAQHPSSPINYPPGLCFRGQRDIAGSWVNDGTGALVPLATLCDVAIQQQEQEAMGMPLVETAFWQAFVTAASPEALEFAHEADVDDVVAYGQTICPSLYDLGTMDELRLAQAEGGLPASFDAAVNVAAIHTYCPEMARSIGR